MNAACERFTDLVGPAPERQGHDDQVAGGALDESRARIGPIFSDDEVPFPVARDHPVGNVGALQSIHRMPTMGVLRPPEEPVKPTPHILK